MRNAGFHPQDLGSCRYLTKFLRCLLRKKENSAEKGPKNQESHFNISSSLIVHAGSFCAVSPGDPSLNTTPDPAEPQWQGWRQKGVGSLLVWFILLLLFGQNLKSFLPVVWLCKPLNLFFLFSLVWDTVFYYLFLYWSIIKIQYYICFKHIIY